MKASAILVSAFLAGTTLAAPLTEARRARHAERMQARHAGRPMIPDTSGGLGLAESDNVTYSSNWAGAVLIASGYTAM